MPSMRRSSCPSAICRIGARAPIALAPDVSGAMAGTPMVSRTPAANRAGLFTVAVWKRYPDARVLPFGTAVLPTRGLRVRDLVAHVAQGQTNEPGAPFMPNVLLFQDLIHNADAQRAG